MCVCVCVQAGRSGGRRKITVSVNAMSRMVKRVASKPRLKALVSEPVKILCISHHRKGLCIVFSLMIFFALVLSYFIHMHDFG